jgi:predicted RNase H-like HicB family nuclease
MPRTYRAASSTAAFKIFKTVALPITQRLVEGVSVMKTYYALVHKDEGSAFGVSFPDLPGCFGAADEEADIHEAAVSALVFYAHDESNLPEPRSMPQLERGAVLLAIPFISARPKAR